MRLADYLHRQSIDPVAFAKRIGVHPTTVYRLLRGHAPSWETAKAIRAETNGEVTADDFFTEEPEPEPEAASA